MGNICCAFGEISVKVPSTREEEQDKEKNNGNQTKVKKGYYITDFH